MTKCKFKIGDRVRYGKHVGVVIDVQNERYPYSNIDTVRCWRVSIAGDTGGCIAALEESVTIADDQKIVVTEIHGSTFEEAKALGIAAFKGAYAGVRERAFRSGRASFYALRWVDAA